MVVPEIMASYWSTETDLCAGWVSLYLSHHVDLLVYRSIVSPFTQIFFLGEIMERYPFQDGVGGSVWALVLIHSISTRPQWPLVLGQGNNCVFPFPSD